MKLNEYTSYKQVMSIFNRDMLWDLFDGDQENLNIAHECLDRYREKGTAVRIKFSDGHTEEYSFQFLSDQSSKFANYLERIGIQFGERVGIMLEPSLEFYVAMFGAIKRGAIAVPLFTLFGPEALRHRVVDCKPKLLILSPEKTELGKTVTDGQVMIADSNFMKQFAQERNEYRTTTKANDLAIFQYTSGTTRQFPEAVKHTHMSVVTLALAGLFGTGLREGDRFFCPSSPAWGHGLWHGTIAPLSLGIETVAYSGKFDAKHILDELEEYEVTNFAAASTVYRMLKLSGLIPEHEYKIKRLSYTGEAIESDARVFIEKAFGVPLSSMYGTTETGVILVNYPGFEDYPIRPGSLGKPVPGGEVTVLDEKGNEVEPGQIGEIAVKRKSKWLRCKDMGLKDEEGYFWYKGRADDVIISSGWTISAVEVEDALMKYPGILQVAVIGVPDKLRGHIVKAYIIKDKNIQVTTLELQEFVKKHLSAHEYPREIVFVNSLPQTPVGKVNRKALRELSLKE